MTIPMPAPMVEVDKQIVSSELQYTYLAPSGGLEHGTYLSTTDQAEAYADQRVKQALELAELQIMKMHEQAVKTRVHPDQAEEGWNESCADRAIALGEAVLAIRALTSKEQE